MDGVHDLGGMHGFGAVNTPGSEAVFHEPWEARVAALHQLMRVEGLGAGPSGRATRETMEPAHYLRASYYERWLWSAEQRLLRAGTLEPGEVEAMMERLAGGAEPPRREDPEQAGRALAALRRSHPLEGVPEWRSRFTEGDQVRVRRMRPGRHTRCPRYARGAVGVIERVQGLDGLPERAAYGERATPEPVYSVRFDSRELWGAQERSPWTVMLDLWESYLEPAEGP